MMVQKEHSNGHPRPRSKLECPVMFLAISPLSSSGNGSPARLGVLGEVVVDRLQRTGKPVPQHFVDPAILGFPGEETDAQVLRLDEVGRQGLQHRKASRDMEAADADGNAGRAKRSRHVHRARKLVRLHADQKNQSFPGAGGVYDPCYVDLGVDLVHVGHADIAEVLQDAATERIAHQARHAGERIRRDQRAPPLQGIAVVVVAGRLDQK